MIGEFEIREYAKCEYQTIPGSLLWSAASHVGVILLVA